MPLDGHLYELHHLGNDLEEWCEIRVRKDLIPKGATLVEAYLTEKEIVVMGQPNKDDENHNCDSMGCGTLSHVLYRMPLPPPGSATGDHLIIAFVQGAQYWEYLRTGCTMWGDDRNIVERAAAERVAAGTLGKSPNEKGQP